MVDFQLDEMQEMLRELAREFARDEIRPHAEHWDEQSIYPKETIQLAHEMGLLNLHIPEAYGGPGLGCMEEVLVNEELAWGDPGFATAAYATALACAPIITGATEEQKNVWLRKVAEEGALASYAVTEPGAGSDVAAIQTTAIRDGDDYIINGSKMWITGAGYADFYKRDLQIKLLDPIGTVVELWDIKGAFLKSVGFDSLSYTSDGDLLTISKYVRLD